MPLVNCLITPIKKSMKPLTLKTINEIYATNLIQNGNFADSFFPWTSSGGILSVADNVLRNIGNGAAATVYTLFVYPGLGFSGHKYYCGGQMRVTNTICLSMVAYSYVANYVGLRTVPTPIQDLWYPVSTIATSSVNGNFSFDFSQTYDNPATANGKTHEIKEVMAIDLTATFGVGKEPALAQCDYMFPNWFDGSIAI